MRLLKALAITLAVFAGLYAFLAAEFAWVRFCEHRWGDLWGGTGGMVISMLPWALLLFIVIFRGAYIVLKKIDKDKPDAPHD